MFIRTALMTTLMSSIVSFAAPTTAEESMFPSGWTGRLTTIDMCLAKDDALEVIDLLSEDIVDQVIKEDDYAGRCMFDINIDSVTVADSEDHSSPEDPFPTYLIRIEGGGKEAWIIFDGLMSEAEATN